MSSIISTYREVVINSLIPAFGIYEMHARNDNSKRWATYNKRVLQKCLCGDRVDVVRLEEWIQWMMGSFETIFVPRSKYGAFVQQKVIYLDNMRVYRVCRSNMRSEA
jgi:hypothetical protein